jgi:tetratricopeptide (TPR) repeat protein
MSSAEQNSPIGATSTEEKIIEKTKGIWGKYSKKISIALVAVVVLIAAVWGYDSFIKAPAELAANDLIWPAQANFKSDSFKLALNGDGTKNNPGFLKIISAHSGTAAANLSKFYAGSCYLQLGEFDNTIKYLEDFSTSDPELSLRTSGSLGDAYAEKGNFEKAIANYKKAASSFEKDELNTAEYLYRLGQAYDKTGKTEDAIDAFKKLKTEFPSSLRSGDVDKYLAKLGETK